jgi:hypothetical protein
MAGARQASLGELLGAGARAAWRYAGTVLAVFAAQSILAIAVMMGAAVVLAQAFARLPIFDEAVDGSLVAIAACVRYAGASFTAVGGVVLSALLLWQLASWLLVGGLVGVLAQRPEGRAATARCFGAAGAATYLAYARLALCGLPAHLVTLFALGTGVQLAGPHVEYALTVPQLVGPLALGLLPGALLLHFFWTVTDYARIEITLRHETQGARAARAYLGALAFVARSPRTLVHSGVGWLAFLAVTAAYAYVSTGHPMYGAGGAITLFLVRQGVALLRVTIRVAVLAGQVELGRARPLPARRAEAEAKAKG